MRSLLVNNVYFYDDYPELLNSCILADFVFGYSVILVCLFVSTSSIIRSLKTLFNNYLTMMIPKIVMRLKKCGRGRQKQKTKNYSMNW